MGISLPTGGPRAVAPGRWRHGAVGYDLRNLSFLLVDDNPHVLGLLRIVLRAFGARRLYEARDGMQGFQIFKAEKSDVIFTDYEMSPLSGLEFLELVRQSSESPNPYVPVIMATAGADRRLVVRARDSGVTEVLVKPFSASAVMEHLVSVIENPRPFIKTASYFGPDRRRRAGAGYEGPERRGADADGVNEVVITPEQAEALEVSRRQVDALIQR